MLPAHWKPRRAANLVRVGNLADGGYVVDEVSLRNADILLSCELWGRLDVRGAIQARSRRQGHLFRPHRRHGVLDEAVPASFARRACEAIGRLPTASPVFRGDGAVHVREKVGPACLGGTPVREIIGRAEGRRAFLKIDIERWEYRILDELAELGAGVQGLVIEFHDVDLHRERIDRFLDGLKGLELVHIHGNNVGGYDANGDPLIVEMSFARPAAGWNAVAERTYPFEGLDYPNDPALPERPLRFRIDQASGGTPSRTR